MPPHQGAEVLVAWLRVCSEVFQGQPISLSSRKIDFFVFYLLLYFIYLFLLFIFLLLYFMLEMPEIVLYRIYFCQKRLFYGRLEQLIDGHVS